MKKAEFLNKLNEELEKRNVADAADILEEYEQHFDLKLADGFFEEEIAARLGDPAMLAAQFDESGAYTAEGKRRQAADRDRPWVCRCVRGAVLSAAGGPRHRAGRRSAVLRGSCGLPAGRAKYPRTAARHALTGAARFWG